MWLKKDALRAEDKPSGPVLLVELKKEIELAIRAERETSYGW